MSHDSLINQTVETLGCHLSWPELRPCVADKQALLLEEGILVREEKFDYNDRPTYYTAVRNLQGFIAFHLNKHKQALRFFQDALDKDNRNINALGNLAFLNKKLCKMDKYREYRGKLAQILARTCHAETAMAYADKAHAIRYLEHKRCFRYMRFIERAVAIGRECDGPQRAEWLFDYALALYKRDFHMLYLRQLATDVPSPREHSEWYSEERILNGFKEACRFFLEVARTSTSTEYEALSWVFLGILVNHDPENRSIAKAFPNEPDLQDLTPTQCFEKGYEMLPEHAILIRRVGSEYVKLGDYDKAEPLLEKSFRQCKSQFVYRFRALMFLGRYETATDKQTDQARAFLQKAVEEFTHAVEIRKYPADYSDLGYVNYLLGNIDEAISNFSHAVDSDHDHFFDPVQTHQRWAKCLAELNDHDGSCLQLEEAEKAREEILRTPLAEDQSSCFNDDFDNYSIVQKPGYVRIIEDYHFIAPQPTHPEHTRTQCKYPYDFFVWNADRDSRWTEVFVCKLETEYRLLGCMAQRDFGLGQDILHEILRCMKESYKIIIVLSPHRSSPSVDTAVPSGGGWESYIISQAVFEGNKRGDVQNYILSIVLRDCTPPETLQTVDAIKCEAGQIPKNQWIGLGQKLTQEG